MTETPLDAAHAAMQAAPEEDAPRLRFYARLADDELFLLLEEEGQGDTLTPRVFALDSGPVVLAFDSEERLAEFTGAVSAYAALPGRVIAQQLAGQGVGLGLNLGVAPSSTLLGPEAVDWLAGTLDHAPSEAEARPAAFQPPGAVPEALLSALGAKLARGAGVAEAAWLAAVTYTDGRRGHILAFTGTRPGAEAALARAAGEALTFSGLEAGEIDVAFLAPDDPAVAALSRVALRFDLAPPAAAPAEPAGPKPPGSDPAKPPILR